jgi:hypothetical protein
MGVRRVEVLIREGEVVVVLDSAAECERVFEDAARGPLDPEAAAAGDSVLVPVDLWLRVRESIGQAEAMLREYRVASGMRWREVDAWLREVDRIRGRWLAAPRGEVVDLSRPMPGGVSHQATDA